MEDARKRPAPSHPFVSFLRFVVYGGSVGLVCGPSVALLALLMPWPMANAIVTVTSTLLCTEIHARFTFRTGRRAGCRQHWQSATSAAAAYATTSTAVFLLHTVEPSAGVLWEQSVYFGASACTAVGRFLVLLLFVFTIRNGTITRSVNLGRSSPPCNAASPSWPSGPASVRATAESADDGTESPTDGPLLPHDTRARLIRVRGPRREKTDASDATSVLGLPHAEIRC
ncbi:GtrA domain-containing protein [Streptomyces sp. 7R007]